MHGCTGITMSEFFRFSYRVFRKQLSYPALAGAIALTVPGIAAAELSPGEDSSLRAITLRVDNDLFAGSDRGYTNGVNLGFLSQTVDDFQDERLPEAYRWLNRGFGWLQPEGYAEYNMSLTLGHGIFTPGDWQEEDLVEDDRPYAGVLVAGIKYGGRSERDMHITSLDIGMVGPSVRARELQHGVHKLLGGESFRGWDNQIRDEPVFRLTTQRLRRLDFPQPSGAWQQDLILRAGGGIGNLASSANIGTEWRFGPQLPDNFGSAPLLPVSENIAPSHSREFSPLPRIHGFLAFNLHAVFHDITLDGNTWKDSHSVERKPLVADLGIGVAASYGSWHFAFAHYVRSREFEEQKRPQQLGSLTVWQDL